MLYLYVKAIHIIFVICWMAGLFYIVRLFIYHVEANDKSEVERNILHPQYELMESRLWNVITTPAMVLSVLAGAYMFYLNPYLLEMNWMWVKIGFVIGLLVYHFICQRMIHQLRKGIFKWTSMQLRMWNEVATLLLFAIVFVVILKSALNWIYGLVGLFLIMILLMIGIKAYKRYRLRKG
ncbi:putative membrane protein [Arcticibacter pallidicorallinus]|uniref:Protoporphyrinogen IX oxidase n=1 Tax=Arcticibacter pallidicorallinus TaxID=1259464 RepID=A0A2T0UAW3_9SPHI|nr:CopD family protein [Arcticibacter pallidicorallinus]PRY55059.1 putative membrane protein [Arcticibacter pallidicorallinus]